MLAGEEGCARFEDRDGNRYALDGELEGLPSAGEVTLEGRYTDDGICAGVGTIAVDRVEPPPTSGSERSRP
jgi:hypothetical protein